MTDRITTPFGARSTADEVIAGIAIDPANARRLWDVSVELTGVGKGE